MRTQIQLDERQAERLKAVAASRGLSMAEWIRRAVDSALLSGGLTNREDQRRRAIAASGRFDSGVTDISVEHDKYLAEAFGDHLPSSERKSNEAKDRPARSHKKVAST
ncbi:MAG: CopG family transcriptional regulator [Candidatus Aminicenantes bacterium]|nr:CopG family transcriptional regulator [Candidatus Aminicenantes bacterium]